MDLIQRVKDILLKPKDTWPVIAREPGDVASIYTTYVMILAAIPAVAGFIGLSLIGMGFGFRIGIMSGLFHMVLSYVLSLASVFILALIVDALAPTFGGVKNQVAAVKLVAYSMTAAWIAGVFGLIPMLGILSLLASLYSIYLIYTGITPMMKSPADKAAGYTAVVVVIGIVVMVVLGAVSSSVVGGAMVAGMGGAASSSGDVVVKTPGGEVTFNSAKMEEAAKRMEAASKRVEAAASSGDQAAVGKAVGEMMGALGGAAGGTAPIAAQDLKALLPEALGSLKRESFEASGGQAVGIAGSSAKARYAEADKSVQLTITDLGGLGGMAALAGWANMTVDKETQDSVEKVYKQGGRTMREEYRKDGGTAELTVILQSGVLVEARGDRVGMPELKQVIATVNLDKLESLKRAAR